MMAHRTLAPVIVNDEPVGLLGDPKPSVRKILLAAGKFPDDGVFENGHDLYRVDSATGAGQPLQGTAIVDRTSGSVPLRFRAQRRHGPQR